MSGLLKRGNTYRTRLLVEDNVKPSDLLEADDSGLSAEDRSEILAEIDRMTSDSRAGLSPDALTLSRATRRGFVFPLIVNLAMAVIVAGGLLGLYAYFQQEEQAQIEAQREGASARAELLRRIQEQAQAELEQKEQEIADIQQRLGDIEARRAALETNLEGELARREAELRAELEAELAAERSRLEDEEVGEGAINERIAILEAEGNARIEAELAELRAQVEAEQAELDETLAELESEFQGELQQLEQDRAQIIDQAQQREAQLRSQFEQQLSASQEELTDAQAELGALSDRREREQQAANQIVGYYDEIRTEIRSNAYGEALGTIEQLRSYLSEESVASLPAVAQRREAELFILSSLEQLVEEQRTARSTDTDALIAQSRTVQEATRLVNEGNAAFEAGDIEEAEALYNEALNLIPAVAEGHRYFVSAQQDVIEDLRDQQIERSEAAEAAISEASASFAAADYGAALAAYQEAIALLPQDAEPAEEVISRIRASAVAISDAQTTEQQTEAAAPLFAAAEEARDDGNYQAAVDTYLQVAAQYPRSRQMAQLPGAVRSTITRATGELQDRIDTLQTDIAELETQNQELQEGSGERQEQLASLRTRNAELQTRVEELRTELDETGEELDAALSAAETRDAQPAEADSPGETAPVVTPELSQEIAQLREVEEDYEALRRAYLAYANREDDILESGTDAARLQTKLLFDSFLASRPVREALPGLRDRIKAYDRAFEEVGRETALLDTVDIIYELSAYETTERKLTYLAEQRRNTSDPNMTAFLDELEVLIRESS
ncbi:MAG: hypothetical protein GVY23_00550 [Spirochaetes bacterium]|jgi:tetratricopeptide (TPR) repeat protein|nr:hypothetical protein [Spirochaetota bacterium]